MNREKLLEKENLTREEYLSIFPEERRKEERA